MRPRNGRKIISRLDRQRIDKWLWHARLVRTRSAAAALVAAGHVRLDGERVTAPGHAVKAGTVITLALQVIALRA